MGGYHDRTGTCGNRELCDFIRSSPTAFKLVETVSKSLDDAGFTRLEESGGEYPARRALTIYKKSIDAHRLSIRSAARNP